MAPAGVTLAAPDQGWESPLQFKRNSLAMYAHIRMVSVVDEVAELQQDLHLISFPVL